MGLWIKQSTSIDIPVGPFVDNADGFTAETGLTITQPDVRLKKNGGAWAQKNASQTLSHEENGWYEVTLDSTDTDTCGHLVVAIYESGALHTWREFLVVPANTYDALVLGTDVLQADVTQFGGSAGSFSGGRPAVNMTYIAGNIVDQTSPQLGVNVVALDNTAVDTTLRSYLGLAAANLDSQLATLSTFNPETLILEGGSLTWGQAARGWTAALFGKSSGLDASPAIYRDSDDTKNRITATVDEDGNRSVVVLDLSP